MKHENKYLMFIGVFSVIVVLIVAVVPFRQIRAEAYDSQLSSLLEEVSRAVVNNSRPLQHLARCPVL
jgi:hypothetical protein